MTDYVPITPEYIREKEIENQIREDLPFGSPNDISWLAWVRNLFIIKQLERGRKADQSDFAAWLGISQNNMSQWITAKRKPTMEGADILAQKLGYEVYDRLGLPRRMPKDPELRVFVDDWPEMSAEEKRQLLDLQRSFRANREERRKGKKVPQGA